VISERTTIEVMRGDTFDIPITLKVSEPEGPLDITGYEFTFTAKHSSEQPDSEALVQVTVPAGANSQSIDGEIVVPINATESANLPRGRVSFDVQMTTPAGQVYTILHGDLFITGDITRNT